MMYLGWYLFIAMVAGGTYTVYEHPWDHVFLGAFLWPFILAFRCLQIVLYAFAYLIGACGINGKKS